MKKSLQHFIERISPFHEDSFLKKIKNRLFPEAERRARRKRYTIALAIFVVLNSIVYLATYNDYKNFALGTKKFSVSTEQIDQSALAQLLSNEYGQDNTQTIYTYITIAALLGIVIWIEYVALRKGHQQFGWKPKQLLQSATTFIAVHALYVVPVFSGVLAQTYVMNDLIASGQTDIAGAVASIARSEHGDTIAYGFDDATVKILLSQQSPYILDGVFEHQVVINYLDIQDRDTFYRAIMIPTLVKQQDDLNIPHTIVLFPSNKIAISDKAELSELKNILIVMSNKAVQESTLHPYIATKPEPEIAMLNAEEYVKIENEKLEVKKQQFLSYLSSIQANITENNRYIQNTESSLANIKNDKLAYERRVRPLLDECIATYGASECGESSGIVERALSDYDKEIQQVETYLAEAKTYVPLLNREYALSKNAYDQFRAYPISPELQSGIFEPPKNILIKYYDTEGEWVPTASNYYYTLLHELIHYYSYTAKNNTPTFIDEGITDLLALQIGTDHASPRAKVDGYLEEIQIASKIFDVLGSDNATRLFFKKSQSDWQIELDKKCGAGCYKKLEKIGNQLTYAKIDDVETRSRLLSEALGVLQNLSKNPVQ